MDQPALKRSLDRDGICTELVNMAQAELSALFKAVTERFGTEQAELSAEEWLQELEARRALPSSAREWRQLTVRVIAQLANRLGPVIAIPACEQLQTANY